MISASVDHVDVTSAAVHCRDRAEQDKSRGHPAASGPEQQEMTIAADPSQLSYSLLIGVVDDADDSLSHGSRVHGQTTRQRSQPWRCRLSSADEDARVTNRVDQQIELGAAIGDGGRATRRLKAQYFVGAEAHHGASGQAAWDRCRRRVADDVERVGSVVEAHRQAKVRVGSDVVTDHTAGPLRGQDQVHAQAAAPLGDADERVEEVGLLADQ